jgi:hypothetical protein
VIISGKSKAFISGLCQHENLANKVKTLVLKNDFGRRNACLQEFVDLLPLYQTVRYLKTIDLRLSVRVERHLALLRNMDFSNYLLHVEQVLIQRSERPSLTNSYLLLNLQLKATITHLDLLDCDYQVFFNSKKQAMSNFLDGFFNLCALSIRKSQTFTMAPNTINFNLVDVLCACPRLAYLLMNCVSVNIPAASLTNDDDPKRCNVKSLHLVLPPESNVPYIAYISHYTTAYLDYLHIELSNIPVDSWINGLDRALLVAFTQRLKTIRHVMIETYSSRPFGQAAMNQEHLETRLLLPLSQFTSMIYDRFTSCHLKFQSSFHIAQVERLETNIELLGGRLYLRLTCSDSYGTVSRNNSNLNYTQCLDSLYRIFGQEYLVNSFDLQCRDLYSTNNESVLPFLLTRFNQLAFLRVWPGILCSNYPLTYDCLLISDALYKDDTFKKYHHQLEMQLPSVPSSSALNNFKHILCQNPFRYDSSKNSVYLYNQMIKSLGNAPPNLQTATFVGLSKDCNSNILEFQNVLELTLEVPTNRILFFQVVMEGYHSLYYRCQLAKGTIEFKRVRYNNNRSIERITFIKGTCIRAIRVVHKLSDNRTCTQFVYPWQDRKSLAITTASDT